MILYNDERGDLFKTMIDGITKVELNEKNIKLCISIR